MKKEILEKIYNMYMEIFDNEINNGLKKMKENNDVPKECSIFLQAAYNSLNNSIKLMDKNDFVDSLSLLRCSFESILFSIAISFDKKLYSAYKCFNGDIYVQILKEKYNKEKQKNPKFKEPNWKKKKANFLSPKNTRIIVSKKYKLVFDNFFCECDNFKKVSKELDEIYKYLCSFTHPTVTKIYVYKIQNDFENLNNIKKIFKLNIQYCKMLLLLGIVYFCKKEYKTSLYDLYAVIFLLNISLIDDVENIDLLLKKYKEYLYLDITKNYLKTDHNRIENIKNQLMEIQNVTDSSNIIAGVMYQIIEDFCAHNLLKKYNLS